MSLIDVFLFYVCPTIGSILSTIMFAAPVQDMRKALIVGHLGCLDPVPFVFAAGNTLGWCIYGHLLGDPFLVAANLPSFFVSLWLNYGAAKLQYHQMQHLRMQTNDRMSASHQMAEQEQWDASPPVDDDEGSVDGRNPAGAQSDEDFVFVPQERQFFRMIMAWAILSTYAYWFTDNRTGSTLVGWVVNANLVFFYGAPLHTLHTVVRTADSSLIHRPTLTMNFVNTSFWMAYGMAQRNGLIVLPNASGFLLGVAQATVCVLYPAKAVASAQSGNNGPGSSSAPSVASMMTPQPIAQDVDDFD